MSNQKIEAATLKEYVGGPFFPPALSRVQQRFQYHPERLNLMFLDMVVHALPSGKFSYPPHTSDRYVWAAGISFMFEGVRCKVLIPMRHDHLRTDGTYADRHVALHTKNIQGDEQFHERAAALFAELFVTTYKNYYATSIGASKKAKKTAGEP